jgi:hypothetical protein
MSPRMKEVVVVKLPRRCSTALRPQLDLSFAAAAYGLVGLFLGSLIGELLVAALLPRHRFAR